LIRDAGADPIAERLRLRSWDVARGVLEAAEMSNWGEDLPPGTGRGVALVESFGVPVAMVVEVTQTPEGLRLDRLCVAVDGGPVLDPVNFENQVQGGVIWGSATPSIHRLPMRKVLQSSRTITPPEI
jgi:isoquinoline 1-oxidoreductase subunit beta